MAKMIPTTFDPNIKSAAEAKLFGQFRHAHDTEAWVVLHSLALARHTRSLQGETDFLVIAPRLGVFALEVKGGRVSVSNGTWRFTNRYGETSERSRSPFLQASEGMHTIRRWVSERDPSLGQLLFGYGVMFPDITFDAEGIEFDPCMVYDKDTQGGLRQYVLDLSRCFRSRWKETYPSVNPVTLIPTPEQAAALTRLLRPNFDPVFSLGAAINQSERSLVELTGEQLVAFEQIEDNPRIVIDGGAGTGKTLLAVELVKRLSAEGKRVGVFCFNNLLAARLRHAFQKAEVDQQPTACTTFHQYLLALVKETQPDFIPQEGFTNEFFRDDLPLLSLEALDYLPARFDVVVMDEAQDLVRGENLDVLDALLVGGLKAGRWLFFGDFRSQVLFSDRTGGEMLELLSRRAGFTRYTLSKNCRNTLPIVRELEAIVQADIPALREDAGVPVRYRRLSGSERFRVLEEVLRELLDDDVQPGDIVVLSMRKIENSLVSKVTSHRIDQYDPAADVQKGITFGTIQAFKGLESPVVVLVDDGGGWPDDLLYTAVSRATTLLVILEGEPARKSRLQAAARRLNEARYEA